MFLTDKPQGISPQLTPGELEPEKTAKVEPEEKR